MDASVKWHGNMAFIATANSGHEIVLDAASRVGGHDLGTRPLELMLISLAGCTAMDVISIMRKKRQNVTGFEVEVHAEQAQDHPHVFTNITVKYLFYGQNLDPAAVERSIELSETKYCPAQAMLAQVAPVSHTYEIVESAAE